MTYTIKNLKQEIEEMKTVALFMKGRALRGIEREIEAMQVELSDLMNAKWGEALKAPSEQQTYSDFMEKQNAKRESVKYEVYDKKIWERKSKCVKRIAKKPC